MLKRILYGLSILMYLPFNTLALEPPPEDLSPIAESVRAETSMPAMGVVVLGRSEILGIGVAGERKLGSEIPVNITDRFHLGSNTKSMTSVVLASLVQTGQIKWTDTVAQLFNDQLDEIHAAYRDVTLLELLNHQSGLPSGTRPDGLLKWMREQSGDIQQIRAELSRKILSLKPEVQPHGKMHYSNYGYIVAGAAAEKISGKSWESLMQQRLFEPLSMNSAGFGVPGTTDPIDTIWGHRAGLLWMKPTPIEPGPASDNPVALGPAGTIHASLQDYANYVRTVLKASRGEYDLLDEKSWQAILDLDRDYSAGWSVVERGWAKGKALTHSGSNTMFMAVTWIAPELDLAVIATTNVGGNQAFRACDQLVGKVMKPYLDDQ